MYTIIAACWDDAFYYNWALEIDCSFQQSFIATHENMASLNLSRSQSTANLAADLRRAFSGIVAGNVKPQGIQAIQQHGPYQLTGDADIMSAMDSLLDAFVQQKRMKVCGQYDPCYKLQNVL